MDNTRSLVDLRIDIDDENCRSPTTACSPSSNSLGHHHRRSTSLPSLMDSFSNNTCFYLYSYNKLPEEPLKLSVLKLDGSSFEIEVLKSATIGEVRQAVEAAFSHMPQKGPGKISWPHVWGHFCLCYDGQKLLTETDYIKNYGIKDGDQLQFIRHASSNYNMIKKRPGKQIAASESPKISPSPTKNYEDNGFFDDVENESSQCNEKCDDIFTEDEASWNCFFRRWSMYSRLSSPDRTISWKTSPSRSACAFFGSFRRIIQLCGSGSNSYSRRDTWRED